VDWHELNKKRVADLREMMGEHLPEVQGITQMKKDALVEMLAEKLGIERPTKRVTGMDKSAIKAEIQSLKQRRQEALAAHDHGALKRHRRHIHRLKRRLRRAATLR
jgi:cell division FtsZ-interacting protein ZapD